MPTVKLLPGVRAVTFGAPRTSNDCLLQVTPSFVPSEESSVTVIWLFAVTAVVFTTTEVADAGIATDPADAAPQTAGFVDDEQLAAVA